MRATNVGPLRVVHEGPEEALLFSRLQRACGMLLWPPCAHFAARSRQIETHWRRRWQPIAPSPSSKCLPRPCCTSLPACSEEQIKTYLEKTLGEAPRPQWGVSHLLLPHSMPVHHQTASCWLGLCRCMLTWPWADAHGALMAS